MTNRGFAAPYNPREAFLVLRGNDRRIVAPLDDVDVRRFAPGETTNIQTHVRVPHDLPPGTYELALWLPDGTKGLREDPRYSIELANVNVWDPETGDNVLS